MRIFITGTDTDVGKTVVSSWLCLHSKSAYFKPIQTGNLYDVDTATVQKLSTKTRTYKEAYSYSEPLSPHLAAELDGGRIDLDNICLPDEKNLIVEGAGGLLVPLNENQLLIDLVKRLQLPVILVARSSLGTINHTLLSLEALRQRDIPILGVIMNGENKGNEVAIERYGKTPVLASFPRIVGEPVTYEYLSSIPMPDRLRNMFMNSSNKSFIA